MHHREVAGLMTALAPIIGDFVSKAMLPLKEENLRLSSCLADMNKRIDDLPASRGTDEVLILRLVEETVAKIPPVPAAEVDMLHVDRVVSEKVDAAVAALPTPQAGKDADPEVIALMVQGEVAKLPPAAPGKDVDPEIVAELVNQAVAALPRAKDGEPGKSVTVEDLTPLVSAEVAQAVAGIEVPALDWSEIDKMIGDRVSESVAALPPPVPGKDVDPEQVAAIVAAEVEKAVADLPRAKDGVGLAGALIDREGQLVVTLTDGATKTLGVVVGKDVDPEAVDAFIRGEIAKIEIEHGVDCVGFDDMDVVEVDGDMILRFTRGDVVKDFPLPVTTYRGVWTEREFPKGASVTFGGSLWIAERATKSKPDTPDCGWRLACKRGRDGASAFDVARKAGFKGSEREWLDSLRPGPAKPVKAG